MVAVNLSAGQLDDPALTDRVASALARTGLEPAALCIEVIESVLLRDPDRSAAVLHDLKALGVTLAADHFGTGYSSLGHLKRHPLDIVKVDRSFVAGLPEHAEDVAITRAIVAMADALGLEVIGEGVERQAQLEELRSLGVARGQGHLWTTALSAEEVEAQVALDGDTGPVETGPDATPQPASWGADPDITSPAQQVDQVLRMVGHEIANALAIITGYATLIAEEGSPRQAEAAGAIDQATHRISKLLDDLVRSGTERPGEGPQGLEVVAIEAVVHEVVADRASVSSEAISIDDVAGPCLVAIDRPQIRQVLDNLIGNAVKYGPPGSPVDLVVEPLGPVVEVSISDRGPGIDPADVGLIFRKYGRASTDRPGMGLGLYVARHIARSHGGDVRYRRRAGGVGSTFTLRLPLAIPSGRLDDADQSSN